MGREVRKVPADWQHPKDNITGKYKPLYPGDGYETSAKRFMEKANADGLQEAIDWFGQAPDINNYMPNWPESERTHFMMYENTSEGTPISPAFKTPEELARWLADTGASAFGDSCASYEDWLRVAQGDYAPSMVVTARGVTNSVDAL